MRLLIVEDEKALNKVISKRLEAEGYSVDRCFDGEEALDYIAVGEFDAIIMDIMMPKLSGLDVLRQIRSNKNNTPVLLLTAKARTKYMSLPTPLTICLKKSSKPLNVKSSSLRMPPMS